MVRACLALFSPALLMGALAALLHLRPGASERELAAMVAEAAQPGDAVVVQPAWNLDGVRRFAGSRVAVVPGNGQADARALGRAHTWVVTPSWMPPPALSTLQVRGAHAWRTP